MIRKCKYCGNYFDAASWNKITCGRFDCVQAWKRACHNKFVEEEKRHIERRRLNKDSLLRDAKAAKDLGVSYGYYMALYKGR